MENHPSRSGSRSRSHHRRHHSSAVFSKKLTEAHSFGRRAAYDDLCSGPRKFGAPTASSRVDDYNEIFNSSRASRGSSIPVLDLPDVDERECPSPGRFRSSEIDYSKIFGGLSDADFGSTYGELFAGPKGGETSSDETWTPAETGSPSEDSDSFNSYEAPHQVNGKKQFNMSYHKTDQRSRDGTNGTTHIAELHAVPGFTCVIDEETPLRNSKENRQIPPIISGATLNRNVSEGTISGKHIRRAASDFQNRRVSRTTSDGDVKFHSGPCGNTILLNADEINLKKHPTKGPSLSNMSLDNRKRGSYRSMSANFESFESARSSPQFSDEEVDVNSAAAASAIALRKAIAEAQASIRIAKESMERKTGGFDNSFRSSFKDNLKAKAKREGPIAGKAEVLNEKPCETCERVDIAEQVFDGMERPNARKTGSMAPNFRDRIDLSRAKEAPEGTNDRDYISILAGHRLDRTAEREVVEHFHEISRTSKGKAATLVSKQAERKGKIVQSVDEHEQKEKKIVEKTFQLLVGNSEKIKTAAEVHELKKTEENLSAVPMVKQLEEHVKSLNLGHGVNDQIENKKKFRVFPEQEDLKAFCAGKKLEERLENSSEPVFAKELEFQQLVENKNESRLKEAQEQVKNEKQFGVAHKQDDIKEGVVEVANFEEHEENLQEIHGHEEIEKKPKEDCECGEVYEERVEEASEWEENKEPNCSYEEEYHEGGLQEVLRQDVDEGKLTDAYDDKESDNRQEEYCEWEGNVKLKDPQKHEGNENVPEVAYLMEKDDERLQEDAQEWEEIHGMGTETCQSEGNGTTMKSDLDTSTHEESILKADTDACDGDEYVNLGQSEESCKDGEKIKELELDDCIRRIVDGTKASCDLEHSEELKEVDLEDVLDEREDLESAGLAQDDLKCDDALPFDKIDLKEDNMNFEGKQINGNMGHGTSACDQKEWVETMAHELGGDVRHAQEAEVSFVRKADDNDFGAVDGKGVEIGKDVGTTLLPCMFDGEKEIMGKDEEIERNQTTEEDEKNTNETTVREQPEIEKVLQKVVEVDGKNLRKMNAEKVKEREREKDRLAVERAIREARERAFAEARERAERAAVERATAEALQREKAKAQGRFEKASAEAKSLAGKASEEAKLKAQRAAVERATSEARERALQRALSEKSSSAGNEQANRFSTEKLSGISRDNGAKHKFPSSDSQAQGPSSSSKSSNSSCHGAPNATERFDGARGESAQRCQAKLERHQRTVERAAKALAEKNMRDLLAQKEQAERNRLAAGLDAEVKRWSSGKLGNLRALLSTLQYILSSDSGWQSIPLTDMVTTSAVKKAYRKAALCVHPDKLQQRGASIQQKYICEKVFDLLKDAWNKFNSEER